MLLKQARMVCWKKWAATHEYEELKEVVWSRAKERQRLVDRHAPIVMRRLGVEGGCA